MQIFPDIHRVDGVSCNVYIITEPDGLTVVDTGMPGADRRILAAIGALGRSPRDVRHILLTHQHVDHIGGLAALAHATGAKTWASAGDTPAIEGRAERESPHGPLGVVFRTVFFSRLRPAAIGAVVREGDTLPVLSGEGGIRVVETPGHTVGHVSFYLPARRLLFAGDAVRSGSGRLAVPPTMLNLDTSMAVRSVGKLAALDVDACLPGHGAPVLTGAQALLTASAGAPSLSRV
ncbi:MAG TPA: MBL fold metallo-hydrolase [Ktedonobacterales bacterium]|nr:MBL fold metallo-hydrolase [Ktedonobacterales bacterium]